MFIFYVILSHTEHTVNRNNVIKKVAGVEVTNVNKDNILGDEEYSFVYDSDRKELAVVCLNYTLDGQSDVPLIESHVDGLTIYCNYKAELHNVNKEVLVLYGDTTIDGNDLNVISDNITAIRVYEDASLTIKSNVSVEGYNHALVGRDKTEKLIISGASLKARATADGDYGAIEDFRGGIELYDCYLTYPADAKIDTGDVIDKRNNLIQYVEVEPKFTGSLKVGDRLRMGTYNNEPIMWRCVALEDRGPLMLAEEILCLKPFDAKTGADAAEGSSHEYDPNGGRALYGSNFWRDSNLRNWLNSEAAAGEVEWLCGNAPSADLVKDGRNAYDGEAGFLTNFNEAEKAALKSVQMRSTISYPDYEGLTPPFGNAPHTTTESTGSAVAGPPLEDAIGNYDDAYAFLWPDRMFLLDVKQLNEVYKNDELLDNEYFFMGHPSPAVWEALEEIEDNDYLSDNAYPYWLRTPVASSDSVVRAVYGDLRTVSDNEEYGRAYDGLIGVRPAFYLDKPNVALAGKGDYESPLTVHGKDEALTPTPTPKPTATPKPGTTPAPATAPPLITPSPKPTKEPVEVKKVDIGTGTIKIKMGETAKLTANILPEDAAYSDLVWSMDTPDVAELQARGYSATVTGRKPGQTRVYATAVSDNGTQISGHRDIIITPSEDFVNVSSFNVSLVDGSGNTVDQAVSGLPYRLKASVYPYNADYRRIEYSSSDTDIAEIDRNGNVRFKAPGWVRLTADAILYPADIEQGYYYPHIPSSVRVRVESDKGYNETFGFRFMNARSHFGYSNDYEIPYWVFNAAGMTDFEAFFFPNDWNGSCVGMSVASRMFYLGKLNASRYQEGAVVPHDLGDEDPTNSEYNTIADPKYDTLLRMIEIAHVAQHNHYSMHYITRYSGSKDYNGDDLRTMADCVKGGTPVVLSLRTSRYYGCGEGHAVLLHCYKWDEATNEHVFKIYDPSEFVTELRFGKKKNGYYKFGFTYSDTDYTWYPHAYYTTTSIFNNEKVFDEMQLTGTASGTVEAILDGDDAAVKGANNLNADIKVSGASTYLDAMELSGDEVQVSISDDGEVAKAAIVKGGEVLSVEQEISGRMQMMTPEYTLYPGEYTTPQKLGFNYDGEDVVIYYTTDGSEPTHNSNVYIAPIAVNKTMKIRAMATKYGYIDGDEVILDYTFPEVAPPAIDIPGGIYYDTVRPVLSGDYKILYTLDDTDPAENGTEYTVKLNIAENSVLRAVCVDENGVVSEELEESYFFIRNSAFDTSAILVDNEGNDADISAASNVAFSIWNYEDSDAEARIFVSCYDADGICIGVKSVADTFAPGNTTVNIPMPECENIAKIKVLCWDTEMKPLARTYEF